MATQLMRLSPLLLLLLSTCAPPPSRAGSIPEQAYLAPECRQEAMAAAHAQQRLPDPVRSPQIDHLLDLIRSRSRVEGPQTQRLHLMGVLGALPASEASLLQRALLERVVVPDPEPRFVWAYYQLGGTAGPVLDAVRGSGLETVGQALAAVRPPLPAKEEREVFLYACDAFWRRFAVALDSTGYLHARPQAAGLAEIDAITEAASRLLTGRHADLLVQMSSTLFDQFGIATSRYTGDPQAYEPAAW